MHCRQVASAKRQVWKHGNGSRRWSRIRAAPIAMSTLAAIPIWTPAGETKSRVHGMNIHAGLSRIGAEAIPCSTCHMTSTLPNDPAPAPPRAGIPWQLAPVEFLWYGQSGAEICKQLRDPARNGGRDAVALLDHLRHDASLSGFIPRGWEPGEGRSTPPGTFEDHVQGHGGMGSRRTAMPGMSPRGTGQGRLAFLSEPRFLRRMVEVPGPLNVLMERLQSRRGRQEQSVSFRPLGGHRTFLSTLSCQRTAWGRSFW